MTDEQAGAAMVALGNRLVWTHLGGGVFDGSGDGCMYSYHYWEKATGHHAEKPHMVYAHHCEDNTRHFATEKELKQSCEIHAATGKWE